MLWSDAMMNMGHICWQIILRNHSIQFSSPTRRQSANRFKENKINYFYLFLKFSKRCNSAVSTSYCAPLNIYRLCYLTESPFINHYHVSVVAQRADRSIDPSFGSGILVFLISRGSCIISSLCMKDLSTILSSVFDVSEVLGSKISI